MAFFANTARYLASPNAESISIFDDNPTRTISVHNSEAFRNIKPEYRACVALVSFMNKIECEIIYKECKIGRLEVTTDFSKISNF